MNGSSNDSMSERNVIEVMRSLSVGTVQQALQRVGLRRSFVSGLRPLADDTVLAGRARTIRTVPFREDVPGLRGTVLATSDPRVPLIEDLHTDDVLVLAARGVLTAGVLGDLMAERIRQRGAAGVVTDGAVRDIVGLAAVGLPIFAGGFHAATFRSAHEAVESDVPVDCGGVLVVPGDYLLGDREGVVVIPAAKITEVLDAAVAQDDMDQFLLAKLQQGAALTDVQPPAERFVREYEQQRASR